MKTENWNGHDIRFVEVDGEWLAVAKDVATALGYVKPENAVAKHVEPEDKTTTLIQGSGSNYKTTAVALTEFGIYDLVFSSKLPAAKQFKRWVFNVIKQLRQASGLEGFQVFRMLDKQHQKQTMAALSQSLKKPVRIDFIKANTIANKAVSTKFGYPKMVKKGDMTPEMMAAREPILEDVAQLMTTKDRFGLDIHVSDIIYSGLTN